MKRLLVSLAVVAASLAALTAGTSSAAGRKCIPDKQAGVMIVDHTAVIVYCGHAKATVDSKGKTTHWTKGGACYAVAGNLLVGLGKYTSYSRPKALFNAFYLVIPADKDGTSRLGVLHIQRKGKEEAIANNVKVVVKAKLSRGTFSGKFDKGAKFTGSFTCK
jgi:hypothetical protein